MHKSICELFNEQISRVCKEDFTDSDISEIANGVFAFRDLVGSFAEDPGIVFDNLFKSHKVYKFCYPCDVIELRQILSDNMIEATSNLAFFPANFATHFFSSYSVFLLMNNIEADIDLGCLKIIKSSSFSIKDSLLGILVSDGLLPKVYNITRELEYDVPVHVVNSVPGISMPSTKTSSTKYRVNIESLGIKRTEVVADSNMEAVQKVLSEHWIKLYGNKVNRSRKFDVKFWINSPFWDQVVKPARSVFNLKKMAQNSEITLNETEQQILNLIRQIKPNEVQARIAGGWTRDKLLGVESDDIDIAVSHMSGFDFAKMIETWAQQNGVTDVGTAYHVSLEKEADPVEEEKKDPELLVGGISIFGQKIEFVPMRTETYREGSRQPVITRTDDVKEDVLRRDLTINAMYYNIDTGQVEDYVNGKEDLQNMYLRTPADPLKTFTDDPLRILRALRFYSRYPNAQLDPAITEAMQRPEVAEAYKQKVASERAGPEVMKLLAGSKPAEAVKVLFETGFYTTAFNVPEMEGLNPISMDQQNPHHVYPLGEHTLKVLEHLNSSAVEKGLPDDRRVARNLSALFHDFGKMSPEIQTSHPSNPGQMQYAGHEDESVKIAESIMKSMGIPEKMRKRVNKKIELHMRPHLHGGDKWNSKTMGRFLRKLEIPGQEDINDELLEDLYDHAMADEVASDPDTADIDAKKQHYQGFVDFQAQQSENAKPAQKPVLNGHEVMQLIPELKPTTGFIQDVNNQLLDQRYSNPQMTEDEARQFVLTIKPEILKKYQPMTAQNFNLKSFTKVAETPMGGDSAGYEGFHAQEGGQEIREKYELSRPQPAKDPYYKGQLVRMRRRGLSLGQISGKIKDISDMEIVIQWDNANGKGEEARYPRDPAFLAYKIQRIN